MNQLLRYFLYAFLLVMLMVFASEAIVSRYDLVSLLNLHKLFLFHFFLSVFVMGIIYTIFLIKRKYTAFSFLVTALVRMGAVILFIFPLVKKTDKPLVFDTFLIIIPYFILTTLEVIFTLKLINLDAKSNKNV